MSHHPLLYFLIVNSALGCASTTEASDGATGGRDAAVDAWPESVTEACDEDTDGDHVTDPVELAVGSDPNDPNVTPTSMGLRVFVMPFAQVPRPAIHNVDEHARVTRADVAILLDTTGSMANITGGIQSSLQQALSILAGQVDDLAFGAAGYGDFPSEGANSEYDVPFYLVHRMMTTRTEAGLHSILSAFEDQNIIRDGLGPWFAHMRGGDEPEQGWEALRQAATGVGITYPNTNSGTDSVPAFDPASAYPAQIPVGESVGTGGGMGFRPDSLPIIIMVTDTEHHDVAVVSTTPPIALRDTAVAAIDSIAAKVVGIKPYSSGTHHDLSFIVNASGSRVPPSAWGIGSERPANCAVGKCCLIAPDPDYPDLDVQPDPVDGECSLVLLDGRWSGYAPGNTFAKQLAQAVTSIVAGARFAISAELRDGSGDGVDVTSAFVDRVEAVQSETCPGEVEDRDGDSIADTFSQISAAGKACFRIIAKTNTSVPNVDVTQVFPASLQLFGDGLANRSDFEVLFVVPPSACNRECVEDFDCPGGEFCNEGLCSKQID